MEEIINLSFSHWNDTCCHLRWEINISTQKITLLVLPITSKLAIDFLMYYGFCAVIHQAVLSYEKKNCRVRAKSGLPVNVLTWLLFVMWQNPDGLWLFICHYTADNNSDTIICPALLFETARAISAARSLSLSLACLFLF